nr:Biomphalaria glabrata negative elongation factor E-like [Biomphalaria glabrata]
MEGEPCCSASQERTDMNFALLLENKLCQVIIAIFLTRRRGSSHSDQAGPKLMSLCLTPVCGLNSSRQNGQGAGGAKFTWFPGVRFGRRILNSQHNSFSPQEMS